MLAELLYLFGPPVPLAKVRAKRSEAHPERHDTEKDVQMNLFAPVKKKAQKRKAKCATPAEQFPATADLIFTMQGDHLFVFDPVQHLRHNALVQAGALDLPFLDMKKGLSAISYIRKESARTFFESATLAGVIWRFEPETEKALARLEKKFRKRNVALKVDLQKEDFEYVR